MDVSKRRDILSENGLKVTPQRLAVLEAFDKTRLHPTADNIIEYIRRNHPNIASGTVYKTLETFVEKGIIQKVKTDKDVMRYDSIIENHHHLYSEDTDRIEDYFDEALNDLLEDYFSNKTIPDFEIQNIKLQIKGKFKSN
jgi:Fur family peroxide stress response transcriptional regulator